MDRSHATAPELVQQLVAAAEQLRGRMGDGGFHVSYDGGDTWEFINTVPIAQPRMRNLIAERKNTIGIIITGRNVFYCERNYSATIL